MLTLHDIEERLRQLQREIEAHNREGEGGDRELDKMIQERAVLERKLSRAQCVATRFRRNR